MVPMLLAGVSAWVVVAGGSGLLIAALAARPVPFRSQSPPDLRAPSARPTATLASAYSISGLCASRPGARS